MSGTLSRRILGAASLAGVLLAPCSAQPLTNDKLTLSVNAQDGSYQVQTRIAGAHPVLNAQVGALVDYHWLRSHDYPRHDLSQAIFTDALGSGSALTLACSGLEGKPDLDFVLQLYDRLPFGAIQVILRNHTAKVMTVQAIRSVEAMGKPLLDLGAREPADRVLSDSFSENWPTLVIYDLGQAPRQMHRGVGSQLIYNRESKQSLFLGALTADRLLTILNLAYDGNGDAARISSFTADSTGTTDIQKDNALSGSPAEDQVELSLPLNPGQNLSSERLMIAAGSDYHSQLLAYGDAIRRLHRARVSSENLLGWWSWTAYYMSLNEGAMLTNANWMAEHLKPLGYNYFHIDEGFSYARGEYTTSNATTFPHGMEYFTDQIRRLGLNFAVWIAPFEVSGRAWIYEHHGDWLVHTANGMPIVIAVTGEDASDKVYALDTTHPDAQEYMRETYRILTREWGARYIKLDFMDTAAIEGYRYRPNTTALEAQRIGLEIIRQTVGEDVLLDKDGSPMLTPVGLVDEGRTSTDTAHSFRATRSVAPGIAARFYMHRNFFVADPDAFNVCRAAPALFADSADPDHVRSPVPVSLQEAEVSIVLSAISGGMYEIGDDLPTLSAEKDRLALVENSDLLQIAKLSRAFSPVDLLSFESEDELPSVFFLRQDARQSVLAVFNWTEKPRSHTLTLASLGLPADHTFRASDVLKHGEPSAIDGGEVRVTNQPPHSVKVLKLVDARIAAAAPSVTAEVPAEARVGEPVNFSARAQENGVPPLSFHWDFGDGITADGKAVSHTYTRSAEVTLRLTVEGLDGVPARQSFQVKATGAIPLPGRARRLTEPKR